MDYQLHVKDPNFRNLAVVCIGDCGDNCADIFCQK